MYNKKPKVVVNLQKVENGFIVEPEKLDTVFKIPKSLIQPQIKKDVIKEPPKPSIPQQPPLQQMPIQMPKSQQSQQPFWYLPQQPWMQQLQDLNPSQSMMQPQQNQPQPQPQQPQSLPPPPPPPPQPAPQVPEIIPPEPVKRQPSKYQLLLPSCASWFQLEAINTIEKEAFPEFFSGQHQSKNPEMYKKYRNFIVNLYKAQPNQYLTVTACRKVLAGDACSIARIHGFLQHWGIINYSVDPDTCPNRILPQPILSKQLFRNLQLNAKDELDVKTDLNANEVAFLHSLKLFSKNYRPICDYCGIRCGLAWYQQKPIKDVKELILCVKCFTNNNFPSILSSEDFDKADIESTFKNIDILSQPGQNTLNGQEFCFILSYIQDNPETTWDKIKENLNQMFGTKHTEETILQHFLQYPLENFESLEQIMESKDNLEKLSINDIASRIALEEPQIFSDNSNLVSFHLAVFRKFLNRYITPSKGPQSNGDKPEEESKQDQELQPEEIQRVLDLRDETSQRAKVLQQQEEVKINDNINLLINLQMEKLELKLAFLEEYEKLILYEKGQIEQCQKQTLAERLCILQQKLQLIQEQNQ